MPLRASIWLALIVLAAAGCGGGTLSRKALQKQAESIQSLAAEGTLVAKGAAGDRTTDNFVSVHTDYLGEAARKIEKDLGSSHATGSLDAKRKEAERLAGMVADDLDRLHRAPANRGLAAALRSSFAKEAEAAGKLSK